MTTPWLAVSAQTVAGWIDPARCRWSSALGREAIRLESVESSILERSVRQWRAAGVSPRCEPEGAHIGGGVGKLADQNGRGLVVKAFVIIVGERILAMARFAIVHENGFKPAMRTEASLESAIRGVVDESCVVRPHGKKGRETVDQCGAEAVIDSGLPAEAAIKIVGRVERIMSLGDIIGKNGGVQTRFFPLSGFHCFGQLFAVHTNLPGKKTVGVEPRLPKFGYRGFIAAWQSLERKSPIFVEKNEMVVALGGRLGNGIEWIGNVLQQHPAV